MAAEDKDIIRLDAPLMQWAGVEPGVSADTQGSIPLLLVSLMEGDMSIQNFCLKSEQGAEVVMNTLAAMHTQGNRWATTVLSVLQQATEQGVFGDDDDESGSAEEGSSEKDEDDEFDDGDEAGLEDELDPVDDDADVT